MKSRWSFWLMSLSASFALFVRQRLNAVGQIIALQMERSYPGGAGQVAAPGKKPWKSPLALLAHASSSCRRAKLSHDSLPPVQPPL